MWRRRGPVSLRSMRFPGSSRLPCPTRTEAQKRQHLSAQGAQRKLELGALSDCRPCAEHIVVLAFDSPQNFKTAAAEQVKIQRQIAVDFPDQRQPLLKHFTRIDYFIAEKCAKLRSRDTRGNGSIGHTEVLHIRLRKVDAVLGVVHAHVLPEICELQSRTCRIGEPEILFRYLTARVEHQASYRVGRITAIVQHVLHRREPRHRLILTKGNQQIGKWFFRNRAGANGFAEGNKYRVPRATLVARIQFAAPQLEQRKSLLPVAYLVAKIVRDAAVSIDRVKVRPQSLGQKPRRDVKILVVRLGELLAIGTSLGKSGRNIGNAIAGGECGPATRDELALVQPFTAGSPGCGSHSGPQGTMAVLISLLRFISFSKTRLSS